MSDDSLDQAVKLKNTELNQAMNWKTKGAMGFIVSKQIENLTIQRNIRYVLTKITV